MTSPDQAVESALQMLREGKLAGSWTLDANRSEVRLRSRTVWNLLPVKGVFRGVSGEGFVTPAGEASGTVTVVAGSIDTRRKVRDEHLRSATFLDVGAHPHITFTADRVEPAGPRVTVIGELSVRGRARSLSFDALISCVRPGEVRVEGTFRVDRTDFGLRWNRLGMASADNTITVRALFIRSRPPIGRVRPDG